MATTQNINSQFNGALAGEIFVQAFKKADTINKGAITVLPNVIGSGYLPKLNYSASLAPYSCGFDATGTVTYTDKEVATKKYEIKHELCKDEFHQTFQAQAAGLFGAANEIPATIQDAILLAMVENMGALVDTQIWQGTGVTGSFAGLCAQFEGDGDLVLGTNKLAGTVSTVANVQTELSKVYLAIPDAIADDADVVIAVAPNVARNYKLSQVGNYMVGTPVGDKELDYIGVPVLSIAGLPANRMVAYRRKNLGFLTGLEADLNNVSVKDMDESDLSGNIRTKIVFSAGVGYSFGSEIVYYRP
jgi:hypothetical protein